MHLPESIKSLGDIAANRPFPIPEKPGVYAFWWIADKTILLSSNRKLILKGPGGVLVAVEYRDWWPKELTYPCLYVGKTTNLRRRFGLHIKSDSNVRLHNTHPQQHKAKPNTTSCQLRWGIEHIFPDVSNPLDLMAKSVGFSYRDDFEDNAIAERFFEEDRLVGTWRPWFNIDSER
jgi:hypothetical protein